MSVQPGDMSVFETHVSLGGAHVFRYGVGGTIFFTIPQGATEPVASPCMAKVGRYTETGVHVMFAVVHPFIEFLGDIERRLQVYGTELLNLGIHCWTGNGYMRAVG